MTLFTSATNTRLLIRFLAATIFAAAFFLIYDRFSHDVRSPYMTFLFVWPLVLGVLPSALLTIKERRKGRSYSAYPKAPADTNTTPCPWVRLFWGGGVAAVTLSSMLRGIFEIAGTASIYQGILMGIGIAFLAAAAGLFLASRQTARFQ